MLTTDALADYTQGRLDPDADETAAILERSLAEVRRWCGWHVSPVLTADEITLDGPGGRLLWLPSLRVVDLTALTEDGAEVDVDELEWSQSGLVRKPLTAAEWTEKFRGITATITHGYADAPDFEAAVFSVADRKSQAPVGGSIISVGPFRWSEDRSMDGYSFTTSELAILRQYRLERRA